MRVGGVVESAAARTCRCSLFYASELEARVRLRLGWRSGLRRGRNRDQLIFVDRLQVASKERDGCTFSEFTINRRLHPGEELRKGERRSGRFERILFESCEHRRRKQIVDGRTLCMTDVIDDRVVVPLRRIVRPDREVAVVLPADV